MWRGGACQPLSLSWLTLPVPGLGGPGCWPSQRASLGLRLPRQVRRHPGRPGPQAAGSAWESGVSRVSRVSGGAEPGLDWGAAAGRRGRGWGGAHGAPSTVQTRGRAGRRSGRSRIPKRCRWAAGEARQATALEACRRARRAQARTQQRRRADAAVDAAALRRPRRNRGCLDGGAQAALSRGRLNRCVHICPRQRLS